MDFGFFVLYELTKYNQHTLRLSGFFAQSIKYIVQGKYIIQGANDDLPLQTYF